LSLEPIISRDSASPKSIKKKLVNHPASGAIGGTRIRPQGMAACVSTLREVNLLALALFAAVSVVGSSPSDMVDTIGETFKANARRADMPKYLVEVRYTAEGISGLKSDGGSARVSATKALIEKLGGTLECFYFALGDTDAFIVADLPDNATVAAVQMAVNGSGTISSRTVVLLTPSEIDEAAKRDVPFHPPTGL
jgi:uncharacterized protein with GYD domain